eukprot:Nk52_evm2s24 gene=Nk52_evmTU2s24
MTPSILFTSVVGRYSNRGGSIRVFSSRSPAVLFSSSSLSALCGGWRGGVDSVLVRGRVQVQTQQRRGLGSSVGFGRGRGGSIRDCVGRKNGSECSDATFVSVGWFRSGFGFGTSGGVFVMPARGIHNSRARGFWMPLGKAQLPMRSAADNSSSAKILEQKSKVGKTIKNVTAKPNPLHSGTTQVVVSKEKKGWWTTIKEVAQHYYDGFRLLGANVSISTGYGIRLLKGETLSRREHRLLVRTSADMAKLIPFSVFLIIPFMELALPIFLKLFPNMLPSTFTDHAKVESDKKKELKVKLQMAKFLQETINEMAVEGKASSKNRDKVREFANFVSEIRENKGTVSNEAILQYSKLFEDELTLDNLSRPQLIALSKLLELQTYGTTNFLRFQLELKVAELKSDDRMIDRDGVKSLSIPELQTASQARGMRAIGLSREEMVSQLEEWLHLNLHEQVPTSLLLLSRALYVNELPSSAALQQTMASLSEAMGKEATAKAAEEIGLPVDSKTKLELLTKEQKRIQEELIEEQVEDEKKIQRDQDIQSQKIMFVKDDGAPHEEPITKEEIRQVADVIEELLDKNPVYAENAELRQLKELRDKYKSDLSELTELTEYKESVASSRLGKKLEKMINELDKDIDLMAEKLQDRMDFMDKDGDGVITCSELEEALRHLDTPMQEAKIRDIVENIDLDRDGRVSISEIDKIFDLVELSDVDLKPKMLKNVASVLLKEYKEEKPLIEQVKSIGPDGDLQSVLDIMAKKRDDMDTVVQRVENILSLRDGMHKRKQEEEEVISMPPPPPSSSDSSSSSSTSSTSSSSETTSSSSTTNTSAPPRKD